MNEPAKRGPGRPRKNPAPEVSEARTAVEQPAKAVACDCEARLAEIERRLNKIELKLF